MSQSYTLILLHYLEGDFCMDSTCIKACVPLVTGSVRIPSLIFTFFCFSFFCPFDLQIKPEIQKLEKSLFSSYCTQAVVIFPNLLACWFIPGHWWLSDFLRHWMDFVEVMLGLHMFLAKYSVNLCHSLSQFFFVLMKNSCVSWHQAIKNHILGLRGHCWSKEARESPAKRSALSKRNSCKQTELALCHHNWEAGKGRQIKLTGKAQFIKKAQGHKIFPCVLPQRNYFRYQIPLQLVKALQVFQPPCRQAVSDVPIFQVPRSADEGTGLEDTCRAYRPHSWESALLTSAQEEPACHPTNNLSTVLCFHKCIKFPCFWFLMRHFTKMWS